MGAFGIRPHEFLLGSMAASEISSSLLGHKGK